MKQTAVEWLAEQIECFGNKHQLQMSWATLDELFDQAKEMEKEQILQSLNDGKAMALGNLENKSLEQYYEQTYGGKR